MEITFRRLTDDDLPLLHAWLNEPGVVRWWEGDDVSWEAVVRDYGSTSTDPVEHWLAHRGHEPVGWIQCYAAADFADEDETRRWFEAGVERTAAGIDYVVGDPAARGQGLGTAMIRQFVREVVFGHHPRWTQVCASPRHANQASWRALANAGFHCVGTFVDQLGPCQVMVLDRVRPDSDESTAAATSTRGAHRTGTPMRIVPNLWFDSDAEEAAAFYVSLFPDSRITNVLRYTEAGPGEPGTVVTVEFELAGQTFVGINGGPMFPFTEAVSFMIPCADQAEVDYYWDALVDGGEPSQCGWLKDRYGLSWQVVPEVLDRLLADPDPERARRATEAMLGMSKLDVEALVAAADGVPA